MESAFETSECSVWGKRQASPLLLVQQPEQQQWGDDSSGSAPQSKRPRTAQRQPALDRSSSLESDTTAFALAGAADPCTSAGYGSPAAFPSDSQESCQDCVEVSSESEEQRAAAALALAQRLVYEELPEANASMASLPHPDNLDYMPVSRRCCMLQVAASFDLPAVVVALGASYFQRLLVKNPALMAAVEACGFFTYCQTSGRWEMMCAPGDSTAISLYATCIYIAAKVADRINFRHMLSHMLSYLLGRKVDHKHAVKLERACLEQLQWRLGPFFATDP